MTQGTCEIKPERLHPELYCENSAPECAWGQAEKQKRNQAKVMKKIILGLTGQSGAGKSTVGKMLTEKGACVIDCDKLARVVVEPGKAALTEIVDAFGETVLNPDGTMNRPEVASIVFRDGEALHTLNRITHKYIEKEMDEILAKTEARLCVIDAPVLFESGIDKKCEKIVSVLAETETRIQRIMARDGLTREKAEERIFAQKDDDFYKERSDFVLYNNGAPEALVPAVDRILQEVLV